MSGLPWVRLDTAFPTNFKVLQLAADRHWQALSCYVCSLAWSGEHGTDGYIPPLALPVIHGTPRIADQLVEVMLWQSRNGGWVIPDWADHQPSSEESHRRAHRSSIGAIKGNCVRWHGAKCGCWRKAVAGADDP